MNSIFDTASHFSFFEKQLDFFVILRQFCQQFFNVAILFSRYAYLHMMQLSELIDSKTFPNFVRWFKRRAKEELWLSGRENKRAGAAGLTLLSFLH